MTNEEAVRKLEYSKTAYQMLIDEKVDSGKLVGKDVKGEWKADTPLDEAYKSMIEALEMGIKAIKALEQEPCDNAVSRQDVLDLAKKGVLISNGSYKSVCKAINEISSANPIEPCGDAIDRAEAIKVASGYCHPANVAKELAKLPAVNPQEPTDTWSIKDVADTLEKHGLIGEQEPKTGTWEEDIDNSRRWDKVRFYCSECGRWQTYGRTDYCPSCGAKMVEPQERSDKE